MRLLFVTDSSIVQARGGAEVSAFQLALGLRDMGHEVAFATSSDGKMPYEARYFEESRAVRLWKLPTAGGHLETGIVGSAPLSALISSMVKEGGFDLVHVHNWLSAYAAHRARSSARSGQPWILNLRDYRLLCPSTYGWCLADPRASCGPIASTRCILANSPESKATKALGILPYSAFRNLSWRILTRSIPSFDGFVCCSNFLKRRFRTMWRYEKPVLAAHNAVEAEPPGDTSPIEGEVLFVGRLSVEKGLRELIAVFRMIAAEGEARLTMVGSGPLEEWIRLQCSADPLLRDRVRLVGAVQPHLVWPHYYRASVVVTPSVWPEPLGRVPLEAMAAGKPVVASATGGIVEVVEDGRTGILVAPGDAEGLRLGLEELLSDPERGDKMGRRGLRRARRCFSRQRIASIFTKLYEDFVGSSV